LPQAREHTPQSKAQVAQLSPRLHRPFPHDEQAPQSKGQVRHDSPNEQRKSPQPQERQSPGQVTQLSQGEHTPSPHPIVMQAPQSKGQVAQVSKPVHNRSPHRAKRGCKAASFISASSPGWDSISPTHARANPGSTTNTTTTRAIERISHPVRAGFERRTTHRTSCAVRRAVLVLRHGEFTPREACSRPSPRGRIHAELPIAA
jgi:hypothetical protein